MAEYRVSVKEPGERAETWQTIPDAISVMDAAERFVRDREDLLASGSLLIVDPSETAAPYVLQLRRTIFGEAEVDHGAPRPACEDATS